MKISYSAFDCYNRCPLQYKFSYVERIKVPDKIELVFGGLIHKVVQQALRQDPIIPPVEELNKFLLGNWPKDLFKNELEEKQYKELALTMIRNFHASLKPNLRQIAAIEKRFQIPLSERHTLSGAIDRIDKLPIGTYELIDYKTSKKLPTQDEVDRDKQLGIYHWAIGNLWPEAKDVNLTLYFLKHNEQITTKRDEYQAEQIKNEFIETADKIDKEKDWRPKQNGLCDWCDYQHLCPLMKQKIQKAEMPTSEEALKIDDMIADYIAARQKIDELEPKIHDHFDKEKIEKFYHDNGNVTRLKNKKLSVSKK